MTEPQIRTSLEAAAGNAIAVKGGRAGLIALVDIALPILNEVKGPAARESAAVLEAAKPVDTSMEAAVRPGLLGTKPSTLDM